MKLFGVDTLDWRQVKIDWDAITDDTIKAGTPMDKEGHICNDGNVYGILMDDVHRNRNTQGRVVISGCVDLKAAEARSGIKLSAEAKAALPDVWSQGGVSSWNDLTDKPFIEVYGDTLKWDGNTEGLENPLELWAPFYKVSDAAPSVADLANGATVVMNSEYQVTIEPEELDSFDGVGIRVSDYAIILSEADGALFGVSAGTYFILVDYGDGEGIGYVSSLTIPGYTGFGTEQIDPKVLPEALRFGKTTVQGDTLTWDGNTEGLVSVDYTAELDGVYYKVSSALPTEADFANGAVVTTNVGDQVTEGIVVSAMDGFVFGFMGLFMVIPNDNFELDVGVTPVPEKGVYFRTVNGNYTTSLTLNGYSGFTKTEIKTIEPEYLPGAVVLYADAEKYLYADSDTNETSKRITKAQLREFFERGVAMYVRAAGEGVELNECVQAINFIGIYGEIAGTTNVFYYTAEYTAE